MPTKTTQVILGLDPGFASLGYVIARVSDLHVLSMGVIHTKKSIAKAHVLACEDNFERCRELACLLRNLVSSYSVSVICAEAMSFPRQASVAAKMAMVWGVIADLSFTETIPLVQPTPQRTKKALCGHIKASKEEVQAALVKRFGAVVGDRLAAMRKGDREHAADALACIVASEDSEVLRMARKAWHGIDG
jgi:Holliday junction resolvasome RuvABC endonuclease subunit